MRDQIEAAVLPRLPRSFRRPFRRVLWLPRDLADTLLSRRPSLVPPRGLSDVGAGDFVAIGEEFLRHFRQKASLSPSDRVLDAGCGIGRIAVPLTAFLSPAGSYDGFDVVPADIRWCRRVISRRFRNFTFRHADVFNGEYNPTGRIPAEAFSFPYEDSRFDFAFATSLFTHLLPPAARRYILEIARVLKPGGRCLVTCFLLDEAARTGILEGRADFSFGHALGNAFVQDSRSPEAAVAYDAASARAVFLEAKLEIVEVARGGWTRLPGSLSYQDMVVARRVAT